MPPHCDTRDGPVVKAAIASLEKNNVNLILPYVPKEAENELKEAYKKTILARKQGEKAKEVADDWFYETAVRLHREGEGAPYTGLKPAGLDTGPVIPLVEKAIETGKLEELFKFMSKSLHDNLHNKFEDVLSKKNYDINDIDAARAYIQASLGLMVWAHHLYMQMQSTHKHGEGEKTTTHKHEHGD